MLLLTIPGQSSRVTLPPEEFNIDNVVILKDVGVVHGGVVFDYAAVKYKYTEEGNLAVLSFGTSQDDYSNTYTLTDVELEIQGQINTKRFAVAGF